MSPSTTFSLGVESHKKHHSCWNLRICPKRTRLIGVIWTSSENEDGFWMDGLFWRWLGKNIDDDKEVFGDIGR